MSYFLFFVLAVVFVFVVRRQRIIIHKLRSMRIQKGRFKLKLQNNQADCGYEFDISGVTDAEGEEITDPDVLSKIVKEVSSDDTEVVSVTDDDQTDTLAKGTIHVGRSGQTTLWGKAWKNQAAKDAGDDPLIAVSEPFIITQGDPASVATGSFRVRR